MLLPLPYGIVTNSQALGGSPLESAKTAHIVAKATSPLSKMHL